MINIYINKCLICASSNDLLHVKFQNFQKQQLELLDFMLYNDFYSSQFGLASIRSELEQECFQKDFLKTWRSRREKKRQLLFTEFQWLGLFFPIIVKQNIQIAGLFILFGYNQKWVSVEQSSNCFEIVSPNLRRSAIIEIQFVHTSN